MCTSDKIALMFCFMSWNKIMPMTENIKTFLDRSTVEKKPQLVTVGIDDLVSGIYLNHHTHFSLYAIKAYGLCQRR